MSDERDGSRITDHGSWITHLEIESARSDLQAANDHFHDKLLSPVSFRVSSFGFGHSALRASVRVLKTILYQRAELLDGFLGVCSFGGHDEFRAMAGGQHHETHD